MSKTLIKGAVFDLDGVITQTARVHAKAWKMTFDNYLKKRSEREGKRFKPFTYKEDYLPYVDGKPRYQGVGSFLRSRDISIPYGEPSDTPDRETICSIGNRKNELFRRIVQEGGVDIYDTTVSFIRELKRREIKIGVASSSMNCRFILETAALIDLFEVVIGGLVSKEIGLKGKPHPDIFIAAASNMGVHPNQCMMVEDSISGVEAGKNGNFALVLGVARNGDHESLKAHGADLAVSDIGEISYQRIVEWFREGLREDGWRLTYYGYEPTEERLRESLTTVGNGYFATRGCFEGERADEVTHYPGTYIAGLYNKLPSSVYRKTIYNNDLVNCPNWLLIELKIKKSNFISPLQMELLHYKHELNLRDGVMSRSTVFRDPHNRITRIESERIASMDNPHLAAIRYRIIPENYSGKISFRSSLDGTVINYGVARYRELNAKNLIPITVGHENGEIYLHVQTSTSKVKIYVRAKNIIYRDQEVIKVKRRIGRDVGIISETFTIDAVQGVPYTVEKLVSIYTSKDMDSEDPETSAESSLHDIVSFGEIQQTHREAWHDLWKKADIQIEGDRFTQRTIRLHIYHLLVTASMHNRNIDAGMPARGLHGEAYRGHIFWDELFVFPFYNLHFPEITRALLLYRYRRLNGARYYARESGYRGAMYPWQAADGGGEESQEIHFNPLSGKWDPDLTRRERHVSVAIAYNILDYFNCSKDREFLHRYGAEMLVEIARFWTSIATYDSATGKYHIVGVMGPDEFHEKYPDSNENGVKDNAYTNIMVSWFLNRAIEMVHSLPEPTIRDLTGKIGFETIELEKWREIAKNLYLEISKDGIVSQFKGYMDLEELDWEYYRNSYGNIRRLDRILKAEGYSPDRYKVTKQADVLMIYYLLTPAQVKETLAFMGYRIGDPREATKKNYEYYLERTSHGSTLSHVVHAAILKYLEMHKLEMWTWFHEALKSDVSDLQGGTTEEGIHCGGMGGTIDIILKGFAGITFDEESITLRPNLPEHWYKLSFRIQYQKRWINFTITQDSVRVRRWIRGVGREETFKIEEGQKEFTIELAYSS